jgi:hypothetical protein
MNLIFPVELYIFVFVFNFVDSTNNTGAVEKPARRRCHYYALRAVTPLFAKTYWSPHRAKLGAVSPSIAYFTSSLYLPCKSDSGYVTPS